MLEIQLLERNNEKVSLKSDDSYDYSPIDSVRLRRSVVLKTPNHVCVDVYEDGAQYFLFKFHKSNISLLIEALHKLKKEME